MKRENTQRLAAIIAEFIKEEGLEDGLMRTKVFASWDIVVGEAGARATVGKFLKDGVLYCTINSSMVRTQLYYRKEDIVSRINELVSSDVVKKLVLK